MKSTMTGAWRRLSFSDRVQKRINNVFNHGQFINGPEVLQLEGLMKSRTNRLHAIATSSGTDALIMSIVASTKSNAKIAVPAFTFIASASAVHLAGREIVFVDIDPDDLLVDVNDVYHIIDDYEISALVAVDLFGRPADYFKLPDVTIISDAAQSMGSSYHGIPCGNLGVISTTSFYPTKALGACGDAGMVFTDNAEFAKLIRMLQNHGQKDKYLHHCVGYNSRMDSLQAAILIEKIEELSYEIDVRKRIYQHYLQNLKGVKVFTIPTNTTSNYSYFPVIFPDLDKRNKVYQSLSHLGAAIHYPMPLHLQPCFAHLQYSKGDFPVAESVCERILCLPLNAYMTEEAITQTIYEVNKVA